MRLETAPQTASPSQRCASPPGHPAQKRRACTPDETGSPHSPEPLNSVELALLDDHRQLRREHLAWMPAGMVHEMRFSEPGELICVYADPVLRPRGGRWNGARTVVVDDLTGALLLHLVDADPVGQRRWRCWSLLVDLLSSAARDDEALALPREPRARAIASALMADPADPRGLDEWAADAGVSAKTIARAFVDGTGWTFREWRVRLHTRACSCGAPRFRTSRRPWATSRWAASSGRSGPASRSPPPSTPCAAGRVASARESYRRDGDVDGLVASARSR